MLDFNQLSSILQRLFTNKPYGEELERYISLRNPKTAADIEHYTKEYERKQGKGSSWL